MEEMVVYLGDHAEVVVAYLGTLMEIDSTGCASFTYAGLWAAAQLACDEPLCLSGL